MKKMSKAMVAFGVLIAIAAGVHAFAPSKSVPTPAKEVQAGKRRATAPKASR